MRSYTSRRTLILWIVLRDAVKDGDAYADDILMAMLEEDWKVQKRLELKR